MGLNPESREVKDKAINNVGLPSRNRYNIFVSNAVDELKIGGNVAKAQVWATLAQAEAEAM